MGDPLVENAPRWIERGIAALMLGMVAVVSVDDDMPRRELVVAVTVVATAGWWLYLVGVRLRAWMVAALAVGGIGTLNLGAEPLRLNQENPTVQVTIMITVFLAGEAVCRFPKRIAVATVIGCFAVAIAPFTWDDIWFDSGPVWVAGTALAVLAGGILRALLLTLANLHAAQAELAATAAADERRRIAREVHDVIAHSLAVTMLHLTAARLAVGRGDPGAATEALEEAERAGRRSLADVRRTIGLLRRGPSNGDGDGLATAPPAPLAEDVAELVDGYRAAGLDVTTTTTGDLGAIGAQAGLALYRIVQEALANVARHTPGAEATVEIAVGTGDSGDGDSGDGDSGDGGAGTVATVRVRSAGGQAAVGSAGAGSGVVGMRERAEALGGRCTAGPDGTGGWLVTAELPTEHDDTDADALPAGIGACGPVARP